MGIANSAIATRLGGINNLLGAVSGGLGGLIRAQYNVNYAQIAESPFRNAYASSPGLGIGTNHQYNFGYGGPAPLGAGAGSIGYNGGL